MKFFKKIILILIFLFPTSSSFGSMTFNQQAEVHDYDTSGQNGLIAGIEFNNDGTKMFISYANRFDNSSVHFINEYSLTTPYDVSTKVYAGDSERCVLTGTDGNSIYDLDISSDGKRLFVVSRNAGTNNDQDGDKAYGFDLTSPYDISTCSLASETENLDNGVFTSGSNAGEYAYAEGMNNIHKHRLQSIDINNDGSKLFLLFMDSLSDTVNGRLYEFNLSTPYDVSTLSIVTSAGIEIGTATQTGITNPTGMRFSSNGKRLIITSHAHGGIKRVLQISLSKGFDTSSFTIDGSRIIGGSGNEMSEANVQPRGTAFNESGLKVYIGFDRSGGELKDKVFEYDLVCPFNIIGGKCPSITENSDRTGMAEAQIELARRTIESATNSTLNRLKWIRRNEDKQNLTNLNIDLNFSNKILNSLTKAVRASTAKKNIKEKEQDVFYWSEGSIAVGRMGNTSISSSKEIETNSLTFGADKFTDNNGIVGLAFRYGRDNTDVGNFGSNLDGDTYNLTFYNTKPSKVDTKYIDTIFGIGKIKTDILTVMDGKHLTANRRGKQMYGTLKIKDEIKKNKLTIIPSSQIDFGHTILNAYDEVGTGAISVKKQHVKSRNLRATVAASHDLENERYSIKRHGKLEYQANLKRSSEFKYTYVGDRSKSFSEKLAPGSFHNINGEIGIDIVFPENYSIFIIYERNQALDYGHTDNIHIALGYLPNKDTEYAFKIEGSENLISKFEIKKDINGFDLSFNLNDDLTNLGDSREANIELNKVF